MVKQNNLIQIFLLSIVGILAIFICVVGFGKMKDKEDTKLLSKSTKLPSLSNYEESTTYLDDHYVRFFFIVSFLTEEAYRHGCLRTTELGQTPFMLALRSFK